MPDPIADPIAAPLTPAATTPDATTPYPAAPNPAASGPGAAPPIGATTRTTDIPPGTLLQIPPDQILDDALTRDRAALDEAALWELQTSISMHGLRMPIEVFELATPRAPLRYGLLSGYRRLAAIRALNETKTRFPTIPAFLRTPQSMAECLTAMVEENEIRAEISPWERGRIACQAVQQGVFGTIEEAVARLFPAANRAKQWRLGSLARLVEQMDGWLTQPERLTLRQLMRIAGAHQNGFDHVMRTALEESSVADHDGQWQLLLPIIAESERQPAGAAHAGPQRRFGRPDRPRRVSAPRRDLVIRREQTRDGWCLHFTGRLATSDFCDTVFDEIDRLFGPS